LLLEGGDINLYFSANQAYQVGNSLTDLKTLTIAGTPLTEDALPPGWKIVEVVPTATGYEIYAQDPSGLIFDAQFNSDAAFAGGNVLSTAQVAQAEQTLGRDIDGNNNVPAPAGWAAVLTAVQHQRHRLGMRDGVARPSTPRWRPATPSRMPRRCRWCRGSWRRTRPRAAR